MKKMMMFLSFFLLFVPMVWAYGYGSSDKTSFLEERFMKKAKMVLWHSDFLGLSEAEVQSVHDLKMKVKKDLVETQAELNLIELDLKDQYWNKAFDLNRVNELLDKKYALKSARAKMLVDAYVKVDVSLSEEQQKKVNEMRSEMKKSGQATMNYVSPYDGKGANFSEGSHGKH